MSTSVCAACGAEPVNVLMTNDEEAATDGGLCAAENTDCGVSEPTHNDSSDAGCVCTPGMSVMCLDSHGLTPTACATIFGLRKCGPDGAFGPCLAATTAEDMATLMDALLGRATSCTITRLACDIGMETERTSGDCSKAFSCMGTPVASQPL